MPEFTNFTDPSYKLETNYAASSRLVNLYCELLEAGPQAGKKRIRGIPGMRLFASLNDNPVRGLLSVDGGNRLFAVGGGTFYEIDSHGTPTAAVGSIALGINPVTMAANGFQVAIASAGLLFIAPGDGTVKPVNFVSGAPVQAGTVDFLDQYFIANKVNSRQVFISNLAPDGGTWDDGDTAFKEGYADNIARVFCDNEQLWLFGFETTEVWTDTGALFPFQRVQGAVLKIGCDAPYSVAGIAGWRFWMWKGSVYAAYGIDPRRVSDFGVEEAIKSYGDVSNAEAFCQLVGGHLFYFLTFPSVGKCWVFDMTAKLQSWHERAYFNNGQFSRYRARVYAKAFGKELVGDPLSGDIYQLDEGYYFDAGGVPLVRDRICPYITANMANVRYNQLTLDMATGIGLDGILPPTPGYDPQVMLRWSDNRGQTYGNWITASAGLFGDFDRRVIFNQLGSSRIGKVFQVRYTDPTPVEYNGAYLRLGMPIPGRSAL